ncbi:MAG: YkgB family protein [Gemmatimonadaceae bacterium]
MRHSHSIKRGADVLGVVGLSVLRYGLVLLLLVWGAAKFTAFEAEAIRPLVSHSPFLAWLYPLLGVRGTADLLGVFEVGAALLIASRRWWPQLSAFGSLMASGTFVVTLSFLFTTPDVFAPSSPWGGFLMKDIMLLGAAVFTASEALRRAGAR